MKKVIAFTLYPGVTPLDLVGPLTVLRKLRPTWPFRSVVVAERIEPLDTALRPRLERENAPGVLLSDTWLVDRHPNQDGGR